MRPSPRLLRPLLPPLSHLPCWPQTMSPRTQGMEALLFEKQWWLTIIPVILMHFRLLQPLQGQEAKAEEGRCSEELERKGVQAQSCPWQWEGTWLSGSPQDLGCQESTFQHSSAAELLVQTVSSNVSLGPREKRGKGQLAQRSVSLLSPSLPSARHDMNCLYLPAAMDRH